MHVNLALQTLNDLECFLKLALKLLVLLEGVSFPLVELIPELL